MATSELDSTLVQESGLGLVTEISADEIANSITHGFGLLLSIAGALALLTAVGRVGDAWMTAGCVIYTASLVAVYAASTLSHVYQAPRPKRFYAVLDQGVIYLLIVGTYTPFAFVYLRSGWWWLLTGSMWAVALVGFCSKVLFAHRVDSVSVVSYVLLGWMPLLGIKPMLAVVPPGAMWWMLAGGLCYTVGTVFLMLDQRVRYFHAIWHVLVIAGSALHFGAILFYVLPHQTYS